MAHGGTNPGYRIVVCQPPSTHAEHTGDMRVYVNHTWHLVGAGYCAAAVSCPLRGTRGTDMRAPSGTTSSLRSDSDDPAPRNHTIFFNSDLPASLRVGL